MAWVVGCLALLGGAAWAAGPRTYDIRYRMTVEVETAEGLRTGSAVREVRTVYTAWWEIFSRNVVHHLVGEAVAVEMPGGQTLFVLLRGPRDIEHAVNVVRTAYPAVYEAEDVAGTDRFGAIYSHLKQRRPESELWPRIPEQQWRLAEPPMLVRFRNPADPRTVEQIAPASLSNSFGPGTVLRRIKIEIVDDPVTRQIEARLPWLTANSRKPLYRRKSLDEPRTLPTELSHYHFLRRPPK